MIGYGVLITSLAIGGLGIGLYLLGPALDRWEVQLKEALSRLRESGR